MHDLSLIATGAITFLQNNGFNFDQCFTEGVQYLSREEAECAKQSAYDRFDNKTVFADLQLKETDVESLDFVRRVREAIVNWRKGSTVSLEITSETGKKEQRLLPTISRFEKRLVHQLVRAEFQDLISVGRADFIKIIDFDANREADNIKRMKTRVKESIIRQKGFGWIIEALARGSIDSIDPMYFARNANGKHIFGTEQIMGKRLPWASFIAVL